MKQSIFENLIKNLKEDAFSCLETICFKSQSRSYNLSFMAQKKNDYKLEVEYCFYISDSLEKDAELNDEQKDELQQIVNEKLKEYNNTSENGKYTNPYEFFGVNRGQF